MSAFGNGQYGWFNSEQEVRDYYCRQVEDFKRCLTLNEAETSWAQNRIFQMMDAYLHLAEGKHPDVAV